MKGIPKPCHCLSALRHQSHKKQQQNIPEGLIYPSPRLPPTPDGSRSPLGTPPAHTPGRGPGLPTLHSTEMAFGEQSRDHVRSPGSRGCSWTGHRPSSRPVPSVPHGTHWCGEPPALHPAAPSPRLRRREPARSRQRWQEGKAQRRGMQSPPRSRTCLNTSRTDGMFSEPGPLQPLQSCLL